MESMIGNIVKSLAGRDKGRYFVIIDNIDDDYVLIADGDLRKIEKPKKKKKKHLEYLNISLEIFNTKVYNIEKIYDIDLRKALEQFLI